MDVNKVWLSGIVVTRPVLTKLSSKTMSAGFVIQVSEKFINRDGLTQFRPSLIPVESLGRSAETTANNVLPGGRYTIEGYLRQETDAAGLQYLKVRTFAVYPDETSDAVVHKEGIKAALEILSKSKDKESAMRTLEEMLK